MSASAIQHVSDTAFMIAHHRAAESARPDALFRDPLAGRLAGDKGRAIAESFPTAAMTGWVVAIRTVVIDQLLREAIERGVDRIVNLGAGLDTRPYRLELPGDLTWFEVDYPEVIAFKEERLRSEAPRCRLERAGLDLSVGATRGELLARIAARGGRVLVLTEGVVPYLDADQVSALAADLRGLARLDSWILEYLSPDSHAYKRAGVTRHMRQAPFEFQPPDWFAFFAARGWHARDVRYLPVEATRLGRRPPLSWRMRLMRSLVRPLMPVRRRERFMKSMGYVALEPA